MIAQLGSDEIHEIRNLTPAEKIALIAQLGESLESEQVPLTAAQAAELDVRLTALEHDRARVSLGQTSELNWGKG